MQTYVEQLEAWTANNRASWKHVRIDTIPQHPDLLIIALDGDPAPPPKKKGPSPKFLPMSIVVKRSPISATDEHLWRLFG